MHKKSGFSLLEIMVAVVIIGLLAAIVIPNLGRSKARQERDKFISELNSLTGFALQNAVKTKKLHQVLFNFGKKEIYLNIATEKDKYGKMQYVQVKRSYVKNIVKMIDQLELKNFYVEGKDLAGTISSSSKAGESWFFVSDGICQTVIINYLDNNQEKSGRNKLQLGLVLNPFSAQFEVFDEFKKP
jgi:prepilin-type N-terminal cleavage/methylation domain-containing protein